MTLVDIWINRRPEDVLADRINDRLNVGTMTAAERRTAMDLIRHVVLSPNETAVSACRWCPMRLQLATLRDGTQRMTQFSRLMASAASRRAIGEPCGRCIKAALNVVKRRIDHQPKSTGGAARSTTSNFDVAHHVNGRRRRPPRANLHDPFGTCTTCKNYRRTHPGAALTASGAPEGCPPHNWNEKPRPRQRWSYE